ncbi:ferredoxin-type protein NapF [Colwellia sp. 4_MG-2023]|uniref:ferredoxin-type protein NapF n=1 Tax=unclassified Colwellia TaxID=196834 RepID=UPI001C08489B|nr:MULTISPECIES: ferredoxin-type protein NapF [unclassified Colwellia]MBU2924777.1 ferredoxin-type protein NapF [Colwellia sp. C2M11]MDO6508618.1 ferredoxin-type protein NapF [Colwellia sp. 5_MG-2023]MDO6557247.1 ferredoxin-type protein NapF [Colwellia sp. 4_MG-2023]MDO6653850.1 ferredoxin-type protein NapF [Colwellia sp. 3_MG-2023]MDO6667022.1 ferredoxin-type protein NapF [Colwellia sp. 2_MG-2023]
MSTSTSKANKRVDNPARRRLLRGRIHTKQVLRLPWVVNESVFTSGCTQCQDCINSCETKIITKDEEGFPTVDFSLGECSFCNKCIDACEQPLFSGDFIDNENTKDKIAQNNKPWPVNIDISDKCLAKNSIYCQSCREECETSAIKFHYLNSSIPEPSINDVDCTQCGACISKCPQDAISFIFEPKAN